MSRLNSFLPHARIIVILLGAVGPFILMGMRGERIDVQVGLAVSAGIAAGCSLWVAPLGLRFAAIITAVAALVLQAVDLFGPQSQWGAGTAPVLWVLQGALAVALAYLVWWNQARLRL